MTDPYQRFPGDQQPPVVPTGGYQVPDTGGDPSGFGGPPVDDPLTPGPYPTFDGWARRVARTVGRAFGPGLAILALCTLLPALLTGAVTLWFQRTRLDAAATVTPGQQLTSSQLTHLLGVLGGYVAVAMLASGIGALATSIGWVATLRLMVDQAAGRPASIGAALRYGVRRGPLLWGWYLLTELLVMVGLCFCVAPGLYLALALSMIAPIVAFERGQPALTRSFKLMHSTFGPTVGRLVVLALGLGVAAFLISCVLGFITGSTQLGEPAGTVPHPSTASTVLELVLGAIFDLPLMLVGIAGLLVTYAELRGRQEPLTSDDLATAAA